MTLGEGLFYSTFLIIFVWSIYQISKHKKWKAVGKVVATLVLIGVLIGAGVWGWSAFQERPRVVDELGGFRLGMSPVDVTLAIGEPSHREEPESDNDNDGEYQMFWLHRDGEYDWSNRFWLKFEGDSADTMRLTSICLSKGNYTDLLSIGLGDDEVDVVKKLGEPDNVSIAADGLRKAISYTKWQVLYQIEAGRVDILCIDSTGPWRFKNEYGESPASVEAGPDESVN